MCLNAVYKDVSLRILHLLGIWGLTPVVCLNYVVQSSNIKKWSFYVYNYIKIVNANCKSTYVIRLILFNKSKIYSCSSSTGVEVFQCPEVLFTLQVLRRSIGVPVFHKCSLFVVALQVLTCSSVPEVFLSCSSSLDVQAFHRCSIGVPQVFDSCSISSCRG